MLMLVTRTMTSAVGVCATMAVVSLAISHTSATTAAIIIIIIIISEQHGIVCSSYSGCCSREKSIAIKCAMQWIRVSVDRTASWATATVVAIWACIGCWAAQDVSIGCIIAGGVLCVGACWVVACVAIGCCVGVGEWIGVVAVVVMAWVSVLMLVDYCCMVMCCCSCGIWRISLKL